MCNIFKKTCIKYSYSEDVISFLSWRERFFCKNTKEAISLAKTPVYKVIPYEYALPIILENKIRLAPVYTSWEDKYELFMLKEDITVVNDSGDEWHLKFENDFLTTVFGQSWSLDGDIEAAWRLYGGDKTCVRISTTLGKLAMLVNKAQDSFGNQAKLWFGKVLYVEDVNKWTREYLNNILYAQSTGRTVEKSFFVKRKPYEYEKEVRIICKTKDSKDYETLESNDVQNLIDDVEFDPRLSDKEYQTYSNELKEKIRKKNLNITISSSDVYSDARKEFVTVEM